MTTFKEGDKVAWDSSQGEVKGVVQTLLGLRRGLGEGHSAEAVVAVSPPGDRTAKMPVLLRI